MKNKPALIIIGGANGSGKTTLAREVVEVENFIYLGADEIAKEINPEKPEDAAIEAARHFSRRFNELLEKQESFIVESTLSGLSLRKWIEKARELGYEIEIVFVYLDSVELCVHRVAVRVAKGGHFVPEADIRRRFLRANKNFFCTYKELSDNWSLFLNINDSFEQIAIGDKNGIAISNKAKFSIIDTTDRMQKENGTVSEESLRKANKYQRLGNNAVHKAQEENRRLGIPNWYSIDGVIISEAE